MAELEAIAFTLHVSKLLKAQSTTKYCALSFFADRFLPWLLSKDDDASPAREQVRRFIDKKSLNFAGLVFIWIASKIHETRAFPAAALKNIADQLLPDVHVSRTDFSEAEILFMKALKFNLGTGILLPEVVQEFFDKFRSMARVGKLMSLKTSLNIIDLLHGVEGFNLAGIPQNLAAAAILATTYLLSIPEEKCNVPLLSWLAEISGVSKQDIKTLTRKIITVVFNSL